MYIKVIFVNSACFQWLSDFFFNSTSAFCLHCFSVFSCLYFYSFFAKRELEKTIIFIRYFLASSIDVLLTRFRYFRIRPIVAIGDGYLGIRLRGWMASALLEPMTGIWGQKRSGVQGLSLCSFLVRGQGRSPPPMKLKDIHFFDAQRMAKFGQLSRISVPGLGIGEFLIREYSFVLLLTANCYLCVMTMVTRTFGRTDLGGSRVCGV